MALELKRIRVQPVGAVAWLSQQRPAYRYDRRAVRGLYGGLGGSHLRQGADG